MPDRLFNERNQDLARKYSQEDFGASLLRVGLASLGPLGAVVGEFATPMVPRQRVDRLGDFCERLEERLRDSEEFRAGLETRPGFGALFEQATRAAVTTPSAQKRATSLSWSRMASPSRKLQCWSSKDCSACSSG